jgi:hypothetical protein
LTEKPGLEFEIEQVKKEKHECDGRKEQFIREIAHLESIINDVPC